jgi:DNA polymerase
MQKKELIQWYRENKLEDVIEEQSFNHFLNSDKKNKEKLVVDETKIRETSSFNSIYQKLANKYRYDSTKITNEPKMNLEDSVNFARNLVDEVNNLEDLKKNIENFELLEIKKFAQHTVFGEGNTKADILILGEAPGNNEDIEGRPFCGQSGELLNSMFKAIRLKREDLYITNTLFWRPPGNRTPTEEEIAICRPFVEKHIALIEPKIIVFMGYTALKSLIKTDLTITKARKQVFEYTNQYLNKKIIKTTPMFHPSYLLRQSNKKKESWDDLLFIKTLLT